MAQTMYEFDSSMSRNETTSWSGRPKGRMCQSGKQETSRLSNMIPKVAFRLGRSWQPGPSFRHALPRTRSLLPGNDSESRGLIPQEFLRSTAVQEKLCRGGQLTRTGTSSLALVFGPLVSSVPGSIPLNKDTRGSCRNSPLWQRPQ